MDRQLPMQIPRSLSEDLFTVQDIMTPRSDLLCVASDVDWAERLAQAARKHYSIVPQVEAGRVVGIVHVEDGRQEPLTADWLVSRDTSIRVLLDSFCANGNSELLVLFGQDIVGLVTPADLNKLPARAYFYQVIGALEVALARLLQVCYHDDPDALLALLGAKRRRQIENEAANLAVGNADVDPVHRLYFSDLITCVAKSEECRARLGYDSRRSAQEDLGGLNKLRNCVMHAVCPMVTRVPNELPVLQDRLGRARRVLLKLAKV
ncbi:MAG: CBS domain-containing protein [Anaerolineae bacterium]